MGRRYQLVCRLEEGALAEYYKATAMGPGSPEVLIKLYGAKASDAAYARALAEAGLRTRKLGNPNAVGFDEVGMVAGRIAAVRPFIEGFNLGDALRRLSTKEVVLPPALALYIANETCRVVSSAHASGWVHGAITPGNVILGADGHVRVTEFGALEAMNASEVLRSVAQKGRHAYRAPEAKVGSSAAAGDVYSLGAIAYELLTLQSVAATRGAALSTKRDVLQAPSRLDRRVNGRIDPVIMRALDPSASHRYKTAAEFSEALRGLFSLLGYAPGAGEAAKFNSELFPNEVSVGVSGPVPFTDWFTLASIDVTTSSAEVPSNIVERAPFTSTELPVVDDSSGRSTEPGAKLPSSAQELDTRATLRGGPEPQVVEDWIAPPGAMPDAPRLARKSKRLRDVAPDEPEPAHDTPAPLPQQVDLSAETNKVPVGTAIDWHSPPPRPPEAPQRVRVALHVWLLAILVCLAIAAFVYHAASHRFWRDIDVAGEKKPPISLNPTPIPDPNKDPATNPEPKVAYLTIEADRDAEVYLDAKDLGATPLSRHAVGPGAHLLTVVSGSLTREKHLALKVGEEEKLSFTFKPKKQVPNPKPKDKPKDKDKGSK